MLKGRGVFILMCLLGLATLVVPVVVQGPRALAGGQSESDRPAVSREDGRSRIATEALKEALFYEELGGREVECRLCPRKCILKPGERGDCRARENRGGKLYSLVYGRLCSLSVEPIEKAPLFHFLPGHKRLAVAAPGCNLRCKYCQNWQISQKPVEEVEHIVLTPEQVIAEALRSDVQSICFTFSEPIVFYEYMYDIAVLARQRGLKTSMVSAGYINPEPLKKLLGVLDAVKIDLKGFSEEFYEEIVKGKLEPVLETLRTIESEGTWLEIVNLVVPTLNDDPETVESMCRWIAEELGRDVPLHFSRFFPMYRLTSLPATPVDTLEAAHQAALRAGLEYVYIGNVPGHRFNSTYCPSCGAVLIRRRQYFIAENHLREGRCPSCGRPVAGFW